MVGYRRDFFDKKYSFPQPIALTTNMFDYLEKNIDHSYFLPIKGFEYTTNPKNKKRVSVNSAITRCQAANQQFNWCGDFVFVEKSEILNMTNTNAHCGEYNHKLGYVRKLTPRECLRLMGFSEKFKINVYFFPFLS